MTRSHDALSLTSFGNVPQAYRHEWRQAVPRDPLVLPSTIFKWYHVCRIDDAVPEEMERDARALIQQDVAAGLWDPEYGLNFALVHLSTVHAFLIAGVWREHQELWLRHYVKEVSSAGSFTRIDTSGEDVPGACVWELGVICHERMAWHRYLFSDRTEADKQRWLADCYQGQV